jgi:hypothetical protein
LTRSAEWLQNKLAASIFWEIKYLATYPGSIQLLLGVIIIALTIFRETINKSTCGESMDADGSCNDVYSSSTGIFVTTSLLTLVTGMTAIFSPTQRWRELRAVAENLQSDIFQFRTRTGPYTVAMAKPRRPELSTAS